jgi:hypothetical protein
MDMEKETITIKAANFCWMCSSFLASVVTIEFLTAEVYSSFDLTKVKYNIYRQSREENEKVKV